MLAQSTDHGILDRLFARELVQQSGLGITDRIGDLLQRGVLEIVPGKERAGTIDDFGRSERERTAFRYVQTTLYAIEWHMSVPFPASN